MPLGKPTDNNKPEIKRPTVLSPYVFVNTFSTVDPSRMTFSFWNRSLKITICPMSGKTEAGIPTYDKDSAIAAYFTHTKAYIMANEIRKFLEDPISYNSSGVLTKETLVTISNGEEFNTPGVYLVIRKIDKETGKTLSSYAYQFRTDFYNSVRNYDQNSLQFSTEFEEYTNLEVTQFLAVLDTYVEAMTYAQAYAVVDSVDYNYNQMMNRLTDICTALGVEVKGKKPYNNSSVFNQKTSNGYSANANGNDRSVRHVSPEDIEEDLFG